MQGIHRLEVDDITVRNRKRFALIGAAGYIAPRHMQAIVDVGGEIVAACDTHDGVGILDRYAPDCRFTCNPEEFFSDFLDTVDVVTVVTPNYLHVLHTRQALAEGCDVVLEKPMACQGVGMQSADTLLQIAHESAHTVYPVVQLRYDDQINALREHFKKASPRNLIDCEIDYATYRGDWYDKSWKGRDNQSGGLIINLGVHLFDLCMHVFGPLISVKQAEISMHEASGVFRCQKAMIHWKLSSRARKPHRVFKVAGRNIDLSNQLTVLHKKVYEEVMQGRGFDLEDTAQALRAIDTVKEIASRRSRTQSRLAGSYREVHAVDVEDHSNTFRTS